MKIEYIGNQPWFRLFTPLLSQDSLLHLLKTLGCFPFQATVLHHSLTVKHCGVGFPILKLYIKKHFKRTTGEALQGPRVCQYPQKENHLMVGKSLSSPQDRWTSSGKMWTHVVNYGYCRPCNLRCHILLPITSAKKPKGLRFPAFQDLKDFFTCQSQNMALWGVLFQ